MVALRFFPRYFVFRALADLLLRTTSTHTNTWQPEVPRRDCEPRVGTLFGADEIRSSSGYRYDIMWHVPGRLSLFKLHELGYLSLRDSGSVSHEMRRDGRMTNDQRLRFVQC